MNPTRILRALLELAAADSDRDLTREEREVNLTGVAMAIAAVARNWDEAAYLIAQGNHESHYASHIRWGWCMQHECDMDKDGNPQSLGVWQVKTKYCKTADTLEGQVACSLRQARYGLAVCKTWEGAFAAQSGMLGVCSRPTSAVRVETMRRVREVLTR